MKNYIFIALMLGTTMVDASGLESEFMHPSFWLQESKNYDAKYVNQDLTVSIINPMFSNPTGDGAILISRKSDRNGVCKFYGLSSYVDYSFIDFNAGSERSVIIDASSKLNKIDSEFPTYAIGTITCNPIENNPIPVSDNLRGRYINDDGSVTINTPKFMMNGQNRYISTNSDRNGVCKLYGLTSYVEYSLIDFNAGPGRSIIINASSKFSKFAPHPENYAIRSLICR